MVKQLEHLKAAYESQLKTLRAQEIALAGAVAAIEQAILTMREEEPSFEGSPIQEIGKVLEPTYE